MDTRKLLTGSKSWLLKCRALPWRSGWINRGLAYTHPPFLQRSWIPVRTLKNYPSAHMHIYTTSLSTCQNRSTISLKLCTLIDPAAQDVHHAIAIFIE